MGTRPTQEAEWGAPVNLGPRVNTAANEHTPTITSDGLALFFCDYQAPGRAEAGIPTSG